MRCYDALIGPAHVHKRLQIIQEMQSLAQRGDDDRAALHTASMQVEMHLVLGDMHGLQRSLLELESLAEHLREPFFLWQSKIARSVDALIRGDLELAEQMARAALAQGTGRDPEGVRISFCVQMLYPLMLRGRISEALAIVQEMHQRSPLLASWNAQLGALEFMQGRKESAQRRLAALMARGVAWLRAESEELTTLLSVANLAMLVDDREAMELMYEELLPFAEYHGR